MSFRGMSFQLMIFAHREFFAAVPMSRMLMPRLTGGGGPISQRCFYLQNEYDHDNENEYDNAPELPATRDLQPF